MEILPFHNSIRVLIADDHEIIRAGIISLIDNFKGIQVIDEAENGKELMEKYFVINPDVIFVDVSMPVLSGIEAVYKIKKRHPDVKALFLSKYMCEEFLYDCLAAGGKGLISNDIVRTELVSAIHKVYRGEFYFEKNLTTNNIMQMQERILIKPKCLDNKLTCREKEILVLISKGLTSFQISQKLNISKRTVDTFRTKLIEKLELNSPVELIKFSIRYMILHGEVV